MVISFEAFARELHELYRRHVRLFGPASETMRTKQDGSEVGDTDERMDPILSDFVRERLGIPVLSEERPYDWPPPYPCFAVIDPRDGSNNKKRGLWFLSGSMLTVVDNGRPVFTGIFVPVDEKETGDGFWFAAKGQGAWRLGPDDGSRRLQVSATADPKKAQFFLEGPSRQTSPDPKIQKLFPVMASRNNLTCAIAFTRVAEGLDEAVIARDNKPTDNIHGWLLVEEAGGVVTDWEGEDPSLTNIRSLVYSNGMLHFRVLEALAGGGILG